MQKKKIIGAIMFFAGIFMLVSSQSGMTGNVINEGISGISSILGLIFIVGSLGLIISKKEEKISDLEMMSKKPDEYVNAQNKLGGILKEFQNDEIIKKYFLQKGGTVQLYSEGFLFPSLSGLYLSSEGFSRVYEESTGSDSWKPLKTPRVIKLNLQEVKHYLDSKRVKPEKFQKILEKKKKKLIQQ